MNSKNPHPVTTGVTPPKKDELKQPQCGIDWLQISVEWPPSLHSWPNTPEAVTAVLQTALPPDADIKVTGELIRPMPGYDGGMGATHARLFYHHLNRDQMIGMIMTGEDLQAVLTIPYPHDALIRWAVAKSKKITRLDFAIDVFDREADPLDIHHEWMHGNLATPAKKVRELSEYTDTREKGIQRATTVYVGSRDSERQLRCYDKAAQTGKAGPWIRLELQTRDAQSWELAKSMALFGVEQAGQTALRAFCRAPKLNWYKRATEGPTVPIDPVGRRTTATDAWIYNVALPAMTRVAKEQAARGAWEMYDAIERALAEILREVK